MIESKIYSLSLILLCMAILLSSLEKIYLMIRFPNNYEIYWEQTKKTFNKINLRRFDFLLSNKSFYIILILNTVIPFFLLVTLSIRSDYLQLIFLLIIFILILLDNFRNRYYREGADNIIQLVCTTLFIVQFIGDEKAFKMGYVFIYAQISFSYFYSGLAKIYSREWRNGIALYNILNTYTYGKERFAKFFANNPNLSFFLAWSVIFIEIFFPFCVFLPEFYSILFLVIVLFFHLSNSFFLGLNLFVWAFVATYPSVYYVSTLIK